MLLLITPLLLLSTFRDVLQRILFFIAIGLRSETSSSSLIESVW